MLNAIRSLLAAALLGVLATPAGAGPALLFDAGDGRVLYAEDADNQWQPASLTKIMTAYITFEALKEGKLTMGTKIGCSELANSQSPSKIGLPVGAEMTVEKALQALIVKSANDVAIMLAEAVSGTHEAFVARMNATAARLGMTRTHFANANGLPAPDQVTTARDLARLATAVVRDFPEHAALWSLPEVRVGKLRLHNHNSLLASYAGADGMKTGFICDSGFNVVASATRDGHKLIAVVLGAASGAERAERAANLLEHGFLTHGWKLMFANQTLDTMPMPEDAKGPTTMREAVHSFECGTRRAVAKTAKKGQPVAANGAKRTVRKAKAASNSQTPPAQQ